MHLAFCRMFRREIQKLRVVCPLRALPSGASFDPPRAYCCLYEASPTRGCVFDHWYTCPCLFLLFRLSWGYRGQVKDPTNSVDARLVRTDGKGGRTALLKYRVEVVQVIRGRFDSKYILSGHGGGDCGIRFRRGDVLVFTFDAAFFAIDKELGYCDVVAWK